MSTMIGVSNITNRTDPNSLKSRVFVGNLNTVQMSKTELESIFAKYGAVIGISVHKGYAFVQYSNEASARAAVVGEDSKAYYNMALDVTIASEPKNRKRGRSNVNTNSSAWNTLPSPSLTDLTMQAQALSTLANNPMISLQQLGLEGIMGQPNLAQFAAAASSVLSGAPFGGLSVSTQPATSLTGSRQKYNRLSNAPTSSTASIAHLSSAAKRTRLEGAASTTSNFNNSAANTALPVGARGQNLVSLVSPTDTKPAQGRSSLTGPPTKPDSHANHARRSTVASSSSAVVRSSPASRMGTDRSPAGQPKSIAPPATKTLTRLSSCSPKATQAPVSITTTRVETSTNSSLVSNRSQPEDILICGSCRKLFDQVDELISHKMAGCSLGKTTCEACRCRAGEPTNLECAYCGANFPGAWDLMHHCHNDHGLTIYSLPSPRGSPAPPGPGQRAAKVEDPGNGDSGPGPCDSSPASSRTDARTHETTSHTNRNRSGTAPRKDGELCGTADGDSQQPGAGSGVSDWDADDEYDGEVTDVGEIAHTPEDANGDGKTSAEDNQLDDPAGVTISSPAKQQQQPEAVDVDQPGDDRTEPVSPTAADEQRSPSVEFDGSYTECVSTSTSVSVKPESSPCHHRSRRGEFGRHETIADDEDDYEEDEDGAESKPPLNG